MHEWPSMDVICSMRNVSVKVKIIGFKARQLLSTAEICQPCRNQDEVPSCGKFVYQKVLMHDGIKSDITWKFAKIKTMEEFCKKNFAL